MIGPQTKRYFAGCGVSIRPRPVFSYPKGHPCHGCPYTFRTGAPSCTMGGGPGDCIWQVYRGLTDRSSPARSTGHRAIAEGIENLCRVAERKFGRKYANQLRQRRVSAP